MIGCWGAHGSRVMSDGASEVVVNLGFDDGDFTTQNLDWFKRAIGLGPCWNAFPSEGGVCGCRTVAAHWSRAAHGAMVVACMVAAEVQE